MTTVTTVTIGYASVKNGTGLLMHILVGGKSLCGLGHIGTVRNMTFRDVECRRCRAASRSHLLTLKVEG